MLDRVLPAVVRIEAIRLRPNQGRMIKARVGGSGAIISAAGHVITNYHVADDADYYRCYLTDGSVLEARRVGEDALTDLAVLQLDLSERAADAPPLPFAKFGDSDEILVGDPVLALGSPASLSQSVTRGVVSNAALVLPEDIRIVLDGENVGLVVRWILHDARIFPGNSGGPLVNEAGEIIGINEIGVANLGGAIPGNLARRVAEQLIESGRISRGWSGLMVQQPLSATPGNDGVLVADVAPDSPAAAAGMRSGDVILAIDGHAITGGEEQSVADFTRLEMGRSPDMSATYDLQRGGEKLSMRVKLAEREPAQRADAELRAWGAVFRDLTRQEALDQRLPETRGVWLENVRPGGACGQAEPELRREDVIMAVDQEPVANFAALRALTERLLPEGEGSRTVLVEFRRDGALLNSVLELRQTSERRPTPQARRAWLGVQVQPLTPKLAARLQLKAESGVRVTRVYSETNAAAADLRVGDVVLKIDDQAVTARRPEDVDSFARQIRQFRADTEVTLALWRDGAMLERKVALEQQPTPPAEMPAFDDDRLELTVREMAFEDRARLQLAPDESGLLVESAVQSGWASLAGVRNGDVLLQAGENALRTIADFRAARTAALDGDADWWVLRVKRGGRTLFVEMNLKPLKP